MKKEIKKGSKCPKCSKGYLSDNICVENYYDLLFQCTYCDHTVSDLDLEAMELTALCIKIISFALGLGLLIFSTLLYLTYQYWNLQGIILICLAVISFGLSYFIKLK